MMNEAFNFFFSQYKEYSTLNISLEITAVIFGLLSVYFSKKNHILVFPTGMISTLIFVYLLYKWELLGDLLINAYYFIMSIYGWYIWSRKDQNKLETPITTTNTKEKKQSLVIFISTLVVISMIYLTFDKFTIFNVYEFKTWVPYIDILTTGIFFSGMWLMAKRKIENWIYWIIGDIISIPLYFYKGYTFSSFQYLIFTFIAILGYLEWKKYLNKNHQIL